MNTGRTVVVNDQGDSYQATLVLSRLSGLRQNARAKYTVRLDGESVGRIAAGETKRYHVPAGRHSLQVSIDWGKSPAVIVDAIAGEVISLECAPRDGSSALWVLLRSIVHPSSYLELRLVRDTQ